MTGFLTKYPEWYLGSQAVQFSLIFVSECIIALLRHNTNNSISLDVDSFGPELITYFLSSTDNQFSYPITIIRSVLVIIK